MPKGVPYAESMTTEESSPSGALEKIHQLEKQITAQEKELDEARQAHEDAQFRSEELEQRNYGLKGENDKLKGENKKLTKKCEDQAAEISEFKQQYK